MASETQESGIEQLRRDIAELRKQLSAKEQRLTKLLNEQQKEANKEAPSTAEAKLSNEDIARYSRQLILENFGVNGQLKLKTTSFLIVGMGGLGCPAAQYLAAAGCGRLGLIDYDYVERSNFHRQILHTDWRINQAKTHSARLALHDINPHCKIECFTEQLDSENAMQILETFDVVLDCTDNVATRYLINDACVMLHKPLVSGSALQMDGQLTVYNYGDQSPCYRCIFPVPPPAETVTNCGDGGVLGAITGVVGSLQALEAIKVAIGMGDVLASRMLIFDGARCIFRNIKLRGKRLNCEVCSEAPFITELVDYVQFCGMQATDKNYKLELLEEQERMDIFEYQKFQSKVHLLLDVRATAEFEICRLPGAINMPLKKVLDDTYLDELKPELLDPNRPIVVICRRGNDSQIAVNHMRHRFPYHSIRDVIGGLHEYTNKIDKDFPIY